MAKNNISTFVNSSYESLESRYIVITNSIKSNQIENIFKFSYFFDYFHLPINTAIINFNNDPIYLPIEDNKDLYTYLNFLKKTKENIKIKRL